MSRFEERVNIQPQSTRTLSEQTVMSLAQRVEQFNALQSQIQGQAIATLEQRAVARGVASAGKYEHSIDEKGVTQPPKYKKERFIGGIEISAHNAALKASYLASINSDIKEGVHLARDLHPDDVASFNNSAITFAHAMINNVDPAIKGAVTTELDRQITDNRIRVQSANIKKDNEFARQTLESEAAKLNESVILNALEDNFKNAMLDHWKLSDVVQSQVDAGFINSVQAKQLMHDYEINLRNALFEKELNEFTNAGSFIKAAKYIDERRRNIPNAYTKGDHDKLIGNLFQNMNEALSLNDKIEIVAEDEDKKLRQEQRRVIQSRMISGTKRGRIYTPYTAQELRSDLENSNLTATEKNDLINAYNNRGKGINDWDVIASITDDIYNDVDYDKVESDIIRNRGFLLTDKTASDMLALLRERKNKESVLWTSRVNRARGFVEESLKLSPMEARFKKSKTHETLREFNERVLAGEDAWAVADELYLKSNYETIPAPVIGNTELDKENLAESQKQLEEAFSRGEIKDDEFNYSMELIDKLRKAKQNLTEFEKAKKENAISNKPAR